MKQNIFKSTKEQYRNTMAVLAMMTLSGSAFADGATTTSKGGIGNVKDACGQVSGFFSNIQSILQVASVAVVTIAVIMAGYQIAFAHKRVADVAPILVGALVIGAAGQIASWLITYSSSC
ncbi:MAG: type VI secretion protein [Neisseria sp.]|jgi:trbC/VIRB2 family|uniref:TrbC/VirB2 family protein n=1 Tax=Neisseria sp. oral taxon 014 TaxID=641148 RepID=UPI000F2949E0|nr:TrbC/VirB2 family protein [Neisseria sp. oral taxon 014]RKV76003.1 MAG: type VI secretion protein [Neisseria sp.]